MGVRLKIEQAITHIYSEINYSDCLKVPIRKYASWNSEKLIKTKRLMEASDKLEDFSCAGNLYSDQFIFPLELVDLTVNTLLN